MNGRMVGALALLLVMLTGISCGRGNTSTETGTSDTIFVADTLEGDSAFFFEDDDEGLSLETHTTEVFGDFIFAFTHNGRFQAERVRFPLPVTDLDGTERTISSGRQFRSEFQLPGNDFYTLLLGDIHQLDVFMNDSLLQRVDFQCMELPSKLMTVYTFDRSDGRWFLTHRRSVPTDPRVSDFLDFYSHFAADSLFQQESVAQRLHFTLDEDDAEEEDMEGTIDRDQWPVFRPDIPGQTFVHLDFGQQYPDAHRMLLLQCGISNGMLNVFTFHRDGDRWHLVSYEG